MLLLPASLLSLVLQVSSSAAERSPTAIRKVAPDANEKILPEHLAFASLPFHDASLDARDFLDAQDVRIPQPRPYRPAYAGHVDSETERNVLRRGAHALALLNRRAAACPSGMGGCDSIGQPNKCCQDGTGASCGGGVGACPADAVSCPAELGGGCCIPGYVCQGMGCVPSASATTATTTAVATSTTQATTTVTSTRTTWVDGAPSTVIVTEIVTLTSSRPPTTKTTTVTVTNTDTATESSTTATTTGGTVTGGAPWRPTGEPSSSSTTTTEGGETSTQDGCPTGFYGCLATHGGGCCQTDRDCQTRSCPPQASTTVVSDGRTVVVPASEVPSTATSTCAAGWFLCGSDAGVHPGCCPSGYDCGTASCFSGSASQTGSVQKEQPKKDGGVVKDTSLLMTLCVVMAAVAACNVMV
ncbi:GPI anchored protein, putative [Cordyceps militaris CM01]|uniref:GPI anchored protein, putative n=1 Tax=Cordyceps militaris (strain CM01) TaxID=983644 RepID=G3JR74_CORMM|nr:GPI anchored protein, putative [Cordyceps militaris CM01]EGX88370.1 GPI anchored protein, putative [Cordyceps militaris CM01]